MMDGKESAGMEIESLGREKRGALLLGSLLYELPLRTIKMEQDKLEST
jgi:hypothetical protein